MGWYENQKARNDAKKAGEARPRTGGLGDKAGDYLDRKVEEAKAHEAEVKAAGDVRRAAKAAAKDAKRRERALRSVQ